MEEVEKFADESDRASAVEAASINLSIQLARNKANQKEYEPTGFCLNCGEKLSKLKRFCDKDCTDDHERRVKNVR
jgi:hypothetical protein